MSKETGDFPVGFFHAQNELKPVKVTVETTDVLIPTYEILK